MKPKDKILKVLSDFGITGQKASQVMGITYGTFNKNKSEKEVRHNFNEKNYNDLVDFIKKETLKL